MRALRSALAANPHRRLARDYETHPHRSATLIQLAAINLMTRRLTHETTPNWRDT